MKFFLIVLAVFYLELNFSCAKVREDCACGESNIAAKGRIVNGKATSAHAYPWAAAMFTPETFMCGGSIISDKNILTAGHCVFYNPNIYDFVWLLGMHNSKLHDGQSYTIVDAMLHPKFINHTVYDDYDMALITLQRKIVFSFKVKPICLPLPGDDFSGQTAIVAGWGALHEGVSTPGVELQEIRIKVLDSDTCKEELRMFADFNDESMICGYENKKDACQGDSGGPFFIETSQNHYELLGAVSFGKGCAQESPGVYARLTEQFTLNWIYHYMAETAADVCEDTKKTIH